MDTAKNYKIFQYFEIFIYLLLTIGPINSTLKLIIYCLILFANLKFFSWRIKKYQLVLLVTIVFPMIIDITNITSDTHYSFAGFAYFLPFFLGIFLVEKYSLKDFCSLLERVCFIAAACSLIGMFFLLVFPSVIDHLPVYVFYGRKINTCILFGALRDYTGINFLHRNCGIAYEPGAFQFVTNLGLLLSLRLKQKHGIWSVAKTAVYITATLLTYSSTGVVIMGCILIGMAIRNKQNFFAIVFVAVIFSGLFSSQFLYQVNKMELGNIDSRFGNTFYVLDMYGKKIFGVGSTGYDAIYRIDKRIGSWDTYTNLYLRFGLPFLIVFLHLISKLRKIDYMLMILVALTFLTESIVGLIPIMLFYYAAQEDESFEVFEENKVCRR